LPQVSRYVDKAQIKADGVAGIEPEEPGDRAPLGAQRLRHRRLHRRPSSLRHCLIEQVTADVEPGKAHADPEQEREPPSPAIDRRRVENGGYRGAHRRPQEHAAAGRERPETGEEPAAPGPDPSNRTKAEVVY